MVTVTTHTHTHTHNAKVTGAMSERCWFTDGRNAHDCEGLDG